MHLTHCGLVMPYGDINLGQHWLRKWLVVWQHRAITWTNVGLSSVGPYDMHLIISQEILKNSFKNMNKKVTFLEILPHLPITGINPEAVWWRDDHYDHPLCPGLQPGPPSQTPGGLGQRYWSVSEVMWPPKLVFRRWGGLQGPPAYATDQWFDFKINTLSPSHVIWRQGYMSTLAQVMACCLTAPSHYLNQCWLMISEVLWHSPDSNFTENAKDIYRWNEFEIY